MVITLAVDTFEQMETWFILFGFKTVRVYLEICLATLGKVVMIFDLVRTVTL